MRLRNLKNSRELLTSCPYLIKNPQQYKGHFQKLFPKSQPLYLEIGMGKGQFMINMAQNNPQYNFIGVEKYSNVLARAIKKLQNYQLPNILIINEDAALLERIFKHEITGIYLNFSDPWPKARQAKKRLTSSSFLKLYEQLSINPVTLFLKTDNADFFSYSILELSQHGYVIADLTFDLNDGVRTNVLTEYEEKFIAQGNKIYYLKATKNNAVKAR